MSDEEYSALKADIAARGVLVPIELDEAGIILDGHHRSQIAAELGIDAPTVTRRFESESQKREHVIKLNLARRHLDPIRWAKVFAMLLAERGIATGQGARNDRATSATVAEVAAELGVPARTARDRLAQLRRFDALPTEAQARVVAGDWERPTLREEASRARREERWRKQRAIADEWRARLAELDRAAVAQPVRFIGHLDRFDEANYEPLPLGAAAGVGTPAEWAALVEALTPPVFVGSVLHPDRADLSVTGDGATRPLTWRGDVALLPTGRWVGARLTTPDGQRVVRCWWEWDEMPAHVGKVIRDEADIQQYAARRLALRRLMRPAWRSPGWQGPSTWPDYVDAGDLEDALAEDLAAVRAWRAAAPPDLHDAATVYALGERAVHHVERSDGPWPRFARSLSVAAGSAEDDEGAAS